MSVSSSALLALMGSYLMSFSFFTTWHMALPFVLVILFYLNVALYTFNKDLCRFEGRNIVGRNFDGSVL